MYLCLWLEQTNQILTCLLLSGISERDLMRNGISIWYSVCYTTSDPWAPFRHHVQYCILAHTWSRISENCHSFLSSTRLSQVISRIHLAGLGGQVLRSREAPPERWQVKYKTGQIQNDDVWSGFEDFLFFYACPFIDDVDLPNMVVHYNLTFYKWSLEKQFLLEQYETDYRTKCLSQECI